LEAENERLREGMGLKVRVFPGMVEELAFKGVWYY